MHDQLRNNTLIKFNYYAILILISYVIPIF